MEPAENVQVPCVSLFLRVDFECKAYWVAETPPAPNQGASMPLLPKGEEGGRRTHGASDKDESAIERQHRNVCPPAEPPPPSPGRKGINYGSLDSHTLTSQNPHPTGLDS